MALRSRVLILDVSIAAADTVSTYIIPIATPKLIHTEQCQTNAVLRAFFLVAALHPHIRRKAQEELDRIVGSERLPQFSDQEDLPYISAIIKELFRWGCPVPFGVPKRAAEDNTYKGYFIPAGATVIENVW